jgi:hypothetical protein
MRKSSEPLPGGLVQETEKGQRILIKIKAIVSCLFPFRPEFMNRDSSITIQGRCFNDEVFSLSLFCGFVVMIQNNLNIVILR